MHDFLESGYKLIIQIIFVIMIRTLAIINIMIVIMIIIKSSS